MVLLSVSNVSKSYGAVTVLRDVSLSVGFGERVGLVGANGAGKTTLLRIILGHEQPDSGSARIVPSVELGYLPQTTPTFEGHTLHDLIRDSVGGLRRLERRMRELEAAMAAPEGASREALDEYGHVATRFTDQGGYELDHRIERVLAGLRLEYLPRDRDLATLSGGEKARVGLAALLMRSPDLLLLDEPTSHLDAKTLDWLETYVRGCGRGALVVSHDRQFLNATVTRIVEIQEWTHTAQSYEGDYDHYAAAKAAERAKWEQDFDRQQEEIKELRRRIRLSARQVAHNRQPRDNDKMAYAFFGGRVDAAVSRNVRAAEERLARIEADPIPKPPKLMRFSPRLDAGAPEGKVVLVAEGVSLRLCGRQILRDVSCTLRAGTRVALVGPNGSGKTTLLRVLLGMETPDSGVARRTPGARFGYLAQETAPTNPDWTVFEAYREGLEGPESTLVAALLGNGLFRLEDVTKRVGQLSVGQRRKLEIARLVALRPTALALDEPTNSISLDVLEALEAAALSFPGPVIVVTHDRWFLRRFGGEVWSLANGTLTVHSPGTFLGGASTGEHSAPPE